MWVTLKKVDVWKWYKKWHNDSPGANNKTFNRHELDSKQMCFHQEAAAAAATERNHEPQAQAQGQAPAQEQEEEEP